jgi:predicted nucleic acid-binding Zn ribbon protein
LKGRCAIPIYLWACTKCGASHQVIRKVKDIEVVPGDKEDDELKEPTCPDGTGHEWDRKATASQFKLIGAWFKNGGY